MSLRFLSKKAISKISNKRSFLRATVYMRLPRFQQAS